MLALLGFITVVAILVLIMTKKLIPAVALIIVPFITGIIACAFMVTDAENAPGVINFWANLKKLGGYVSGSGGIGGVAATGVMFIFSVLFFGLLNDAGTFKPIIKGVIKLVGVDPVKIALGTALIAAVVHLDGSGAVTFLITIPALLPLYDAVGMKRTTLCTITALAAGTMNMLPWGGPTLRAATATGMDVGELFAPMGIPFAAGMVMVFVIAFILGRKEKKALANVTAETVAMAEEQVSEEDAKYLRPKNFIINVILIIIAIVGLIKSGYSPAVVFMVMFCIAMIINYPKVADAKAIINRNAQSALMMASVLFAAGALIGIMKGTGMITAMSTALVSIIPDSLGKLFPLIVGVISVPASLLFDPDSFYYGVLPVLAETAQGFGIASVDIARAAITGQMTVGFPLSPLTASTFLLVGLSGVDIGEHQKHTFLWSWLIGIVILVVALIIGVIAI